MSIKYYYICHRQTLSLQITFLQFLFSAPYFSEQRKRKEEVNEQFILGYFFSCMKNIFRPDLTWVWYGEGVGQEIQMEYSEDSKNIEQILFLLTGQNPFDPCSKSIYVWLKTILLPRKFKQKIVLKSHNKLEPFEVRNDHWVDSWRLKAEMLIVSILLKYRENQWKLEKIIGWSSSRNKTWVLLIIIPISADWKISNILNKNDFLTY